MGKKLGLILSGGALIALFLAWMLLKGTDDFRAWIDPSPVLGVVALGVAWLCLLGGAALIARALFHREPELLDEAD